MTTLGIALTTRLEALDQHGLGLVVKQEWIEGMDEKVGEVQRAREEVLGQREEAVERREKDEREREEKVVELEQAIDEREHALDQRGSELEERSKWVEELEEETETCSAQLGGLNASTSALGLNLWSITLLRSVVFCVWATKRL